MRKLTKSTTISKEKGMPLDEHVESQQKKARVSNVENALNSTLFGGLLDGRSSIMTRTPLTDITNVESQQKKARVSDVGNALNSTLFGGLLDGRSSIMTRTPLTDITNDRMGSYYNKSPICTIDTDSNRTRVYGLFDSLVTPTFKTSSSYVTNVAPGSESKDPMVGKSSSSRPRCRMINGVHPSNAIDNNEENDASTIFASGSQSKDPIVDKPSPSRPSCRKNNGAGPINAVANDRENAISNIFSSRRRSKQPMVELSTPVSRPRSRRRNGAGSSNAVDQHEEVVGSNLFPSRRKSKQDMVENSSGPRRRCRKSNAADESNAFDEDTEDAESNFFDDFGDTSSDSSGEEIAYDDSDGEDIECHDFSITDYFDIGDPVHSCQYCGALFWYAERMRKDKKSKEPKFSMCCNQGNVVLPAMRQPPKVLDALIFGDDHRSRHFQDNIRSYNSMFSFTSMGGKIDKGINKGSAPPIFRLNGQNHHRIGALLPKDGDKAKFLQIYIQDPQNEIVNRIEAVRSEGIRNLYVEIVSDLKDMLDEHNVYAKLFRMARDRLNDSNCVDIKMKLIGRRKGDGRQYDLPRTHEVAALIKNDIRADRVQRDVIVETKGGTLQRMNHLNPSFLPLQYPLLYPYGQDGYREDVELTRAAETFSRGRKHVTMRQYFAYRIQERSNESPYILRCKRLFQQFLVDGFTMIEASRMIYIRTHQPQLRSELYCGLHDAADRGETDPARLGKLVVLPNSFQGGPRFMISNYQDAMATCRWAGYPELFLTFTCNPKWIEITRFLEPRRLRPEDRPDIICRVFKIKLDQLINDIKKRKIFGKPKAVIYTVEFQKRGLPHAHIVLFMDQRGRNPTPADIDRIISAEIPDKRTEPEYYRLVQDLMVHGPCGNWNKESPCMDKGKCTKNFPKKFVDETNVNESGFPAYRRRDNGRTVDKGEIQLDNRYVIPHNRYLLLRYAAHINVEWCNQTKAIKYLFKYITKGQDRITVAFARNADSSSAEPVDEIKTYYDCRYVSACEAAWRMFGFPIHYRDVAVERLSFHLPGQQNVVYSENDDVGTVVRRCSVKDSKFNAWFKANQKYPAARELTYAELPSKFTWKQKTLEWVPRKKGKSIGRLFFVRPGAGERYYMRTLLNHVRGPFDHQDIRTFDGNVHTTYKDACYARGLLDDDKEYVDAIEEASHWASEYSLRNLFVTLLVSASLDKPEVLWDKCWQLLSNDIEHNHQKTLANPDLRLTEEQIKGYALVEIEKLLRQRGKSLRDFDSMPFPDCSYFSILDNMLIQEELNYDKDALAEEHFGLLSDLTDEQRGVYDTIMSTVDGNDGGVFFLYGHGGTGKTFLWRTLSAAIRSRGEIVLNVASSAIASLLLPGGRTAHSRFAIPLNADEDSTCNIKQGSHLAELIERTRLIIWDEAPMMNRYCFEALDRTMKDIARFSNPRGCHRPFGGNTIVFGGDFRQILPVIPKGTRQQIVNASLNASALWDHCKVLRLTKNMRLRGLPGDEQSDELCRFSEWILSIGDGEIGGPNDGEATVDMPQDLLVPHSSDSVKAIVDSIYPDFLTEGRCPSYLNGRAILAPTLEDVGMVNDYMVGLNHSELKTYYSSDSTCKSDDSETDLLREIHTPEFLNAITCSGVPSHILRLKVGVPVMLMRNIDHSSGLCNGTRLIVTRLGERVIEARMLSGVNAGKVFLIPRLSLTPSDMRLPFTFQRRQFPLMVCYAMTINKSQGQTLTNVGVYLRKPVFTHGQLYVAVSRVTNRKGLRFVICDDDGRPSSTTTNVVYKEVFSNL